MDTKQQMVSRMIVNGQISFRFVMNLYRWDYLGGQGGGGWNDITVTRRALVFCLIETRQTDNLHENALMRRRLISSQDLETRLFKLALNLPKIQFASTMFRGFFFWNQCLSQLRLVERVHLKPYLKERRERYSFIHTSCMLIKLEFKLFEISWSIFVWFVPILALETTWSP